MRSYQLIFGLSTLLLAVILVSGTTPPRPTTTRRSIITIAPPKICPVPPVCAKNSPRVCGRTPDGYCQRFNNICELILASGRRPTTGVRHTRDIECRNVRGMGAANRRPCFHPCSRRPVVCRQSPPNKHICVRSRNNRQCKVLANNCQLNNQNCHSQPRNNWRRTNKWRCGARQLGDKPQPCVKQPRRTTTRRTTTRRTTTRRTTTRRTTTRRTTTPRTTTKATRPDSES